MTVAWNDLDVGTEGPSVEDGPLTVTDFVRYQGASGDMNPIHHDTEFAKKAGFPKPILHGMCTYGITCRGVLQTYADYDPSAFKQHVARFSSPVFPGETVTMELWKDGNVVSFEAKVKDRGVTVIKSGKTVLG